MLKLSQTALGLLCQRAIGEAPTVCRVNVASEWMSDELEHKFCLNLDTGRGNGINSSEMGVLLFHPIPDLLGIMRRNGSNLISASQDLL